MKPHLFLCGSAAAGLSESMSDEFIVVVVTSPDASDVRIDLVGEISLAIVVVGLGGKTGGGQAIAVANALDAKKIPTFLIVSLPFTNEGHTRCDRALEDLVFLSQSGRGYWSFYCDEFIRRYGPCNLPQMYEHFLNRMKHIINTVKNINN